MKRFQSVGSASLLGKVGKIQEKCMFVHSNSNMCISSLLDHALLDLTNHIKYLALDEATRHNNQ